MSAAAPPNRAAAPTAPVIMGMAPPVLVAVGAGRVAIGAVDVGAGTPAVSETAVEVAPPNTGPLLPVGFGATVALPGLRTLRPLAR